MGYLVKRATASGFEHRTIGQPVGSQLASCPSIFRAGPLGFDYRTGSSTERGHPVLTGRHGFDSRPENRSRLLPAPSFPFFDGSQDWVTLIRTRSLVRVQPSAPIAGVAQW